MAEQQIVRESIKVAACSTPACLESALIVQGELSKRPAGDILSLG